MKGVKEACVDLASAKAQVNYNPKITTVRDLLSAVNRSGFSASPDKAARK